MKYDIPTMTAEAVSLLKSLISIPSISREETQAAVWYGFAELEEKLSG